MPVTGKTGVHSSSRGMCLRHNDDDPDYHDRDHHDDDRDHYDHIPDDDHEHHEDLDLDERETCKTLCHCDTT